MRERRPMVSVVMPVLNGELFVGDAIRSVLDQSFEDFELIVLDDGSEDRSGEIAGAYGVVDCRVRAFCREHRGLVSTLNELLDIARGEYVARLDSDDVCLPGRLRRQVDVLGTRRGVVCVGGSVLFVDAGGGVLGRGSALLGDGAIQEASLRGRCGVCPSASMFRARAARRVGGYRGRAEPAVDLDMLLRLGEVGALANVPDDVVACRQHGGSVSFREGERLLLAAERVCVEAARRRGVRPLYEKPRLEEGVVTGEGIGVYRGGGSVRAEAG